MVSLTREKLVSVLVDVLTNDLKLRENVGHFREEENHHESLEIAHIYAFLEYRA